MFALQVERSSEFGEESKKALADLEEARDEAEREVARTKKEVKDLRERLREQEDDAKMLRDKVSCCHVTCCASTKAGLESEKARCSPHSYENLRIYEISRTSRLTTMVHQRTRNKIN